MNIVTMSAELAHRSNMVAIVERNSEESAILSCQTESESAEIVRPLYRLPLHERMVKQYTTTNPHRFERSDEVIYSDFRSIC